MNEEPHPFVSDGGRSRPGLAALARLALTAPARRLLGSVRRHRVALALGAILLGALALRLLEARRGLPYLHHWDEPFVANRALQILRTGDFNPHFFNYGSLVIYADAAVDALHYLALARLPDGDPAALRDPGAVRFRGAREDPLVTAPEQEPYWVSHPSFYLWNRRLTALFGTLAVALTFALARRLAEPGSGNRAGLAAAFALATCGYHIEQSAWITTDVPAATLALAVLLGTLAFVDGAGPRSLLLAAAALGLAASTKYNSAVFALVPAGALASPPSGARPATAPGSGPPRPPWPASPSSPARRTRCSTSRPSCATPDGCSTPTLATRISCSRSPRAGRTCGSTSACSSTISASALPSAPSAAWRSRCGGPAAGWCCRSACW